MRPSSLRLSGGAGQQVLQRVLQKRREVACDGNRLRLRTRRLSLATSAIEGKIHRPVFHQSDSLIL